jgi:acyl-CoA thioesterase-1
MRFKAVGERYGAAWKATHAFALAMSVASLIKAHNANAQEAAMPPLSPSCRAPAADIATPAPLPHLTAALRSGRLIRVLAIGSSSTVGVGASSPAKNYPAQLEAILERTFRNLDVVVINRGVSGEVAAQTAERFKREVAESRPDLVLWQVGTNDALARVPVEAFKSVVREALQWLKGQAVDTVLIGLQYSPRVARDDSATAIRRAIRGLAVEEGVLLVRRFEAMRFIANAKEGELLSADDLHQNDLGYRCMAEHIARALVISALSPTTTVARP